MRSTVKALQRNELVERPARYAACSHCCQRERSMFDRKQLYISLFVLGLIEMAVAVAQAAR